MTTRFIAADHPAGRILLRSGAVDVGAVSPQGLPRDRLLDGRTWDQMPGVAG